MTNVGRFQRVGRQAWAWFGEGRRWGRGNNAVIAQDGEGLLIDSQRDLGQTGVMLAAVAQVVPETRIARVVLTSAEPHRSWGLGAVPQAAVLGSAAVTAQLEKGVAPAELAELVAGADPGSPLGHRLRELLGDVDFTGVERPRITTTFDRCLTVTVGGTDVELIECGPAQAEANTVVWLPAERILFTGDLVCLGIHPAAWSGSVTGWRAAIDELARLDPLVVLPGHGLVTDRGGLIEVRDYLDHLIGEVETRYSMGMPVEEAAVDLPLRHWAGWRDRANLAVTISALYHQLSAERHASDQLASSEVTFSSTMTLAAEISVGLRPAARIPPLAPGERDAATSALLGIADGDAAIFDFHQAHLPNIHTTLARHADLYQQTVPIARGVVSGLLSDRDRELTILRSAWNCGATYQWSHHRHMALAVGLSEAEIDLLSHPVAGGGWSAHEAAVLTAVDELHKNSTITDQTWAALALDFSRPELIELVTLIGEYHKVSFQLNAWRVPLESWVGPFQLPSGWPGLKY